jgi:hypothetical protein
MPAVDGDRDDEAGALGAHHGEHGAGDVQRAEQGGLDLRPEVLRADLPEEPGVEVPGVVDQDVDPPEPFHGRPDGRLGAGGVGNVELDGQQVVVLAQSRCDSAGVTPGGDHSVTSRECGPGDVGAHAAAGAGDEPDLRVPHVSTRLPG